MTFELPHPEIELPPGDAPLVLVAPSTAHDSGNHLVRTALKALADEPVRVVATTNRVRPAEPDRGPRQRGPGRLAQLQPADAGAVAGHLPRRPRHRRPRPRRRHPGPDLPDHRRHERDRDAGLLGRRRPLATLAALPAGARCAGPPDASSATAPSPRGPASWRPGAVSTTAPSAAPSWSKTWPGADSAGTGQATAPGVGLEPTTPRLTVECSTD